MRRLARGDNRKPDAARQQLKITKSSKQKQKVNQFTHCPPRQRLGRTHTQTFRLASRLTPTADTSQAAIRNHTSIKQIRCQHPRQSCKPHYTEEKKRGPVTNRMARTEATRPSQDVNWQRREVERNAINKKSETQPSRRRCMRRLCQAHAEKENIIIIVDTHAHSTT